MEGICPKCHSRLELANETIPRFITCPDCPKNGITIPGIIHFEPELPTLEEAAKALLKYIEENEVWDECCDDGDGHIDQWRSPEFGGLINGLKEALK